MALKNIKVNYYGVFGFFGFFGFQNPLCFLFFLFFLFFFIPAKPASESGQSPALIKKQAKEKAEHLKKIMEALEGISFGTAQDGNARISNDDVQKLLGVSDRTAQRYLSDLAAEGKLRQNGQIGQSVFYTKAE